MTWPYDKRADPIHAWGTIAAGIAAGGIVIGAEVALHPGQANLHWWWPSDWLTVPAAIVLAGLVLVVLPVRRSEHESPDLGTPTSSTLRGGSLIGSLLDIESSADYLVDGTQVADSRVTARHLPGRPDLLGRPVWTPRPTPRLV